MFIPPLQNLLLSLTHNLNEISFNVARNALWNTEPFET